jgi:uncharacterized protein DUF5719
MSDDDATLPPTPVERITSRVRPPAPRRPRRSLRVLAVAGVLAAAAVTEAFVAPASPRVAPPQPQQAASSGVWYCPVTAETGTAVLSVAAAANEPSSIVIVRHTPEGAIAGTAEAVQPGEQRDFVVDELQSGEPLSVRWSGGPSVVSWRADAGTDQATTVSCSPGPSPSWYLAGLDTARGSTSTLHLFNPFQVDAVARITFMTPEGPEPRVSTSAQLVEAGTSQRLDLTAIVPEVADLGVTVEVENGRLIAAGEVTYTPLAGSDGPRGRTVLPAAEAPGDAWAFAYARAGEGSSSWVSILNPGEREAAVQVSVSDPRDDSDLLPEYSVPAGGTLRVGLGMASMEPEFGIEVSSLNDVPVVVARTTSLVADGDRRGVAASLGEAPAPVWAVAGGGAVGRASQLSIYNAGTAPVTLSISAGEGTTEGWNAIEVGVNDRVTAELDEAGPERDNIPAIVSADGPVVVELRSQRDVDALRLWTRMAVPEVRWRGSTTRPAVRRDPGLTTTPMGLPSEEEVLDEL